MAEEVSENRQEMSLVCPSDIVFSDPGDDVVLSCHLEPAISAASMEIKWWNKSDLVCHYKDGQVIESCEGRVSLSLEELHHGNVSLALKDVRRSHGGHYICEVIHEYQTIKEYVFLRINSVDLSLVVPTGNVSADPGSDIILHVYLSPEMSAVFMEIRWFKETELIYKYKNRQEITKSDYENRLSLSIQELQRGRFLLTLRNVQQSDSGNYVCKAIFEGCQSTGVVHLQVREFQERMKKRVTNKHKQQTLEILDDGGKCARKRRYRDTEKWKTIHELRKRYLKAQLELKRIPIRTSGHTPKSKRRNSMDGHRPSMSDDRRLERHEYMTLEPSDTASTSCWGLPIKSPMTEDLQREKTTESVILSASDQTQTQENSGETGTQEQERIATDQESSTPATQSQVQESETTSGSLAARDATQTPERPEDTTQ